jgi:hypothetical protein
MPPSTTHDLTRQQLDELDALLQRMLALPLNKPETTAVPTFAPPPLPEIPPALPRVPTWRLDPPPSVPSPRPHLPNPAPAVAPEPGIASPLPPPSTSPIPSVFERVVREPFFPPESHDLSEEATSTVIPVTPAEDLPRAYDFPATGETSTLRGVDAPALPLDYSARTPEAQIETRLPEVTVPNPFTTAATVPVVEEEVISIWATSLPFLPLAIANAFLEGVCRWFGPLGEMILKPAVRTLLGLSGFALFAGAIYWVLKSGPRGFWPEI